MNIKRFNGNDFPGDKWVRDILSRVNEIVDYLKLQSRTPAVQETTEVELDDLADEVTEVLSPLTSVGTDGQVLTSDGTTAGWEALPNATQTAAGLVKNGGASTALAYTDFTSQVNCSIGSGDVQPATRWKIVENKVTLWFYLSTITVTPGAGYFSFSLPASIPRPASDTMGAMHSYDGAVVKSTLVIINASGVLTAHPGIGGAGTFTGGTNTNYFYGQISWPVD